MRIRVPQLVGAALAGVVVFGSAAWAQPVGPQAPERITGIATTGPVVGRSLTMVWVAVPGVDQYRVRVSDPSGPRLDASYAPVEVNCLTSPVCSLTMSTDALAPGPGLWTVAGSNLTGEGPASDSQAFTLVEVAPDGTVRLEVVDRAGAGARSATTVTGGSAPATDQPTSARTGTVGTSLLGTNTGFGDFALGAVTTGAQNSAFGYYTLANTTTGAGNTGVGFAALTNNTMGAANTAVGWGTLANAVSASSNTAVGYAALNAATTGVGNVGVGTQSLVSNTTGYYNTSVGMNALYSNTTGYANAGLGYGALISNTSGSYNVAAGYGALSSARTASSNTAVGYYTLAYNTSGYGNTAVGTQAGEQTTTGSENAALAQNALRQNTVGSRNTALGGHAMFANTEGNDNTAVGRYALYSGTRGSRNTAVGSGALAANLADGTNAVAVGWNALASNTNGFHNVAVGAEALTMCTTCFYNAAVGSSALQNLTTGFMNTAVGRAALGSATEGGGNIAVGQQAGFGITTGSSNIAIGNGGTAADDGVIRIGAAGSQTTAFVAGIRGVTTGNNNAVAVLIDSNGQLGTVNSSRRYKTDIRDMSDASSALLRLRPVTFRYTKPYADGSMPLDYGLIAEEVAEVFPALAVFGDQGQPESVKYHLLPALLLNELQKEHAANEEQAAVLRAEQQRTRALEQDVSDLRARLAQIEALLSGGRPK